MSLFLRIFFTVNAVVAVANAANCYAHEEFHRSTLALAFGSAGFTVAATIAVWMFWIGERMVRRDAEEYTRLRNELLPARRR